MEGEKGTCNHTDPNKMSLSASFPGSTRTISFLVVVVVVVLAADILPNCSAAFLSLDKVVRLLLTAASVIRTPRNFFIFLSSFLSLFFGGWLVFPPFFFFSFSSLLFLWGGFLLSRKQKRRKEEKSRRKGGRGGAGPFGETAGGHFFDISNMVLFYFGCVCVCEKSWRRRPFITTPPPKKEIRHVKNIT